MEAMADRLKNLVENGGAPNFASDTDEVGRMFADLQELLDYIHMDATAIANSYETEEEVPFPVGAETIAALALIVQEIRTLGPEIERYADQIGSLLYAIDAVRRRQEARETSDA